MLLLPTDSNGLQNTVHGPTILTLVLLKPGLAFLETLYLLSCVVLKDDPTEKKVHRVHLNLIIEGFLVNYLKVKSVLKSTGESH